MSNDPVEQLMEDQWRLIPASSTDVLRWSFGRVKRFEDLYSQPTFGSERNFHCQCGKYRGEKYIGIICDRCGVKVPADAAAQRRQRMGHMGLPTYCRHPHEGGMLIDEFPICPVGFRTTSSRDPNELGRKYEHLLRTSDALKAKLPPEGSDESYEARLALDWPELKSAIDDIIGLPPSGVVSPDADSLLPRLLHAIATLSPHVVHLARSCCISMEIRTSL